MGTGNSTSSAGSNNLTVIVTDQTADIDGSTINFAVCVAILDKALVFSCQATGITETGNGTGNPGSSNTPTLVIPHQATNQGPARNIYLRKLILYRAAPSPR